MIAKCIKCKKEFEQKKGTRNCGCGKYQKMEGHSKYWHDVSRYFQDPIYQHFRLSHEESLACEMRFVRPIITVISKSMKRK